MKLEKWIHSISSTLAFLIIYIIALSFYLGVKGFKIDEQGNIVLQSSEVQAAETKKMIPTTLSLPYGHTLGHASAPITIYEYSSFGCSHCADFHESTLPKLKENYIDKGLVKLAFTPFPLDKTSLKAAVLAECMPSSKYFDFVNKLFDSQRSWGMSFNSEKALSKIAQNYGLSEQRAESCMKNLATAQEILNQRQEATRILNIQGTPTFVIAAKNSREVIFGYISYDELKEKIEKLR